MNELKTLQWSCLIEYDTDVNAALQRARKLLFDECFCQEYISIEDALSNLEENFTRSILDIHSVGDKLDQGFTCPLPDEVLTRVFATVKPNRQMLGELATQWDILGKTDDQPLQNSLATGALCTEWEALNLGESFYIVLYSEHSLYGQKVLAPSEIFFAGLNLDI